MKNILKLSAIAMFAFNTNLALAKSYIKEIGFVNYTALMQKHPIFNDPKSEFLKLANSTQSEIQKERTALAKEDQQMSIKAQALKQEQTKVEAELSQKIADLQNDAPKLRRSEIQERQDKINEQGKALQAKLDAFNEKHRQFQLKVQAFEQKALQLQQKLSTEQAKAQQISFNDAKQLVEDLAKKKQLDVIFDTNNIVYLKDTDNDFTKELIQQIEKKPLPALENTENTKNTPKTKNKTK